MLIISQRTTFGTEIKIKLIESGKTQRELAKAIGTTEFYLSKILRGVKGGDSYKEKIENFFTNRDSI